MPLLCIQDSDSNKMYFSFKMNDVDHELHEKFTKHKKCKQKFPFFIANAQRGVGVLTDTGEDSKFVHIRKRPKVDTLFSSLFSDVSERRV